MTAFVAIAFMYARDYLRANDLHKGEFYVLGLIGLLGMMIMIGLLCAAPTAVVMLFVISWFSKLVDIPMRPIEGSEPEPEPLPDEKLPGLLAAMLPIILPLVLISAHTIAKTLANAEHAARLSRESGATVHVGTILTSGVFYDPDPTTFARWKRLGHLGVEMEAAELYTLAARHGRRALAVLTVSDSRHAGTDEVPGGGPVEVAQRVAREKGVRIFTVGLGDIAAGEGMAEEAVGA